MNINSDISAICHQVLCEGSASVVAAKATHLVSFAREKGLDTVNIGSQYCSEIALLWDENDV